MWASEKLGRLSVLARLNFVALISLADDQGRGRGGARFLIGQIHPYAENVTEQEFESSIIELEATKLVSFYRNDGCRYYFIPGWKENQYIEKPRKSEIPPPPEKTDSPKERGSFGEASPGEWNGVDRDKDGNGVDCKTDEPSAPPAEARAKNFAPPSLDDVTAYCRERNNGIDPAHFIDYQEARGWMLGKVKMKNWKATIRTWEKKQNGITRSVIGKEVGHRVVGAAKPIPGKYAGIEDGTAV